MKGKPAERRAPVPDVEFRELTREESEHLLAEQRVGRIAYALRDRVDIEPIHLVFRDGWLWGRTSQGTKLDTIQHNRWVAYEVDAVEGLFDWRSVVVHGTFYRIAGDDGPAEADLLDQAIDHLRELSPFMATADDPVRERSAYFRVFPHEVTGRTASSRIDPAP